MSIPVLKCEGLNKSYKKDLSHGSNGINLAPIKGQVRRIWPLMHFLKTEII